MASKILQNEFKSLSKETWTNISLVHDNILEWNVALIVLNPDSLYYGGYFQALMRFPKNYPYEPPSFRFVRPLWHPNIYADGRLCISILHPPGEDVVSGETSGERWSPVQRVESVLISVLSLLDDAECSSPANVDAGVMLRNDPEQYKERVRRDRDASRKDIPDGFVMPTHESAFQKEKVVEEFGWSDSEVEDFESGTDEEMFDDDDEEEEDDQEEDDEETIVEVDQDESIQRETDANGKHRDKSL